MIKIKHIYLFVKKRGGGGERSLNNVFYGSAIPPQKQSLALVFVSQYKPNMSAYSIKCGMHNEGIPLALDSDVISILVAAQCYGMRKFREFLPLR